MVEVFFSKTWPHFMLLKKEKVFQENQMKILEWPGDSPHVNLKKNLWAIIKNRLKSKDCANFTKLIETVIVIWYHDKEIAES